MKKISQGDAEKLLAECMVLRKTLEKAEATIGKWYRIVSRRERQIADLQAEIIRLKTELGQQAHAFRNEMQIVLSEVENRAEKAEEEVEKWKRGFELMDKSDQAELEARLSAEAELAEVREDRAAKTTQHTRESYEEKGALVERDKNIAIIMRHTTLLDLEKVELIEQIEKE